ISELIWSKPPSWRDPVKFSFAHGGKDGVPYPVNTKRMISSSDFLKQAINEAKLGSKEKLQMLKRLSNLVKSNVIVPIEDSD
ncbi:MAG: DUF763 domain-containing protein, partial [Candidatus Odinarchaeia archaeon]